MISLHYIWICIWSSDYGAATMGQNVSGLDPQQLEDYQDCTFFTSKEILHVHKRFQSLRKPGNTGERLSMDEILQLDELKANPFRERICKVFSEDHSGNLSFEDFLDCMSVFSEGATRDVKASYAFRIYDFDGDGYLDKQDLLETLKLLCGENELRNTEMEQVADKILEEADLDRDARLSYVEFEHVISRSPDFINTFRIRI